MQDAYLATIDRFDAMNEFRVSVVAALDAVFPVGEPDYKDQSIEQVRRWREQEAGGPDDGPVEALKELFRRHGVSVHAGYEALAHGAVAAVRAAGESSQPKPGTPEWNEAQATAVRNNRRRMDEDG